MIYMLMQTGNIQNNLTGVNKMEKPKIDRKKSKIGEKVGLGLLGSKQAYEQSVGKRAYALGKNCKNLKGHVAEVMTCDKINLDPRNIIAGRKASVTASRTAPCVDVVVKQKNKVVERLQVKNTPSAAGIKKTVDQVAAGKYNSAKLVGTKETAQAYEEAIKNGGNNIKKKMLSNNVRAGQTEVIQAKTIGGNIVKNGKYIFNESRNIAKKTGIVTAAVSATVNGVKVYKGKESGKEATVNVAKDSAIGYISSGVGCAVDNVVTIAIAGTPAAPLSKPIGGAAGLGTSLAVTAVAEKVTASVERKMLRE